ncbi:MAG: PD-(D/E)XK nuclease family protein, partial [Terriglobales bacterium]
RWARQALEAGETGRIGIVVPELAGRLAAIQRIFADVLQPAAILPGQAAPPAFNISLAPPLAAHPLARSALAILRLAFAPLSFAAASTLLRSPFWGAESEWTARAALEADLRRFAGPEIALDALLAAAGRSGRTTALAAALRRARAVAESQPRRQGTAAWAEAFAALLETAGWPGERPLDSAEFQTAAACRDLIAAFARLEAVAAPFAAASALEELEQLAAARLFQPESPETPVQILGLLESAGLEFARLWVMGVDADSWPLPPRPPAFLPLAAAIEGGVPRATARSQHELARREQERLLAAARNAVLSYPQGQEDVVLSPSPLLAGLPPARSGELDGADASYASRLLAIAGSALETFFDEVGPPAEPAREYHGGAKLLADQAACPFRAFAHWRLDAASLGTQPQAGLDYVDRGTVVHLCLARYAGLRRQGLAASLEEVVRGAIEEAARKNPALRRPELADGEHRRLLRLLEEWVATMEPCLAPYAVHAVEADMAVELAGLRLRVRMDRVDRASDGGEIVLDFKTGDLPRQAWDGPRPDEPQVPLYAAFAAESAIAAAFAQVKPGQMCFSGMADRDGLLPGVRSVGAPWPNQLQTWRAALEGLAREFLAGRARVAPKYGEETCRFCDARPLCRIADFAPAALGDSESEEPGE